MRFATRCIHGGPGPDPLTGAVNVPVYLTSTYRQEAIGRHKGYEYSRTGNPTRAALEQLIAGLEGGSRGLAFGSGLAALTTILLLFQAGDHLILGDDVYGGTFRLQDKVFRRFGLEATRVDTTRPEAVAAAFTPRTRAVLVESPTNPLLKISDLRALAELAHARDALLIVDNTFMTPYFQRPLELGADVVWHSATKYLGGHSDVVLGLVVARDPALGERLAFLQNAAGAVPGPLDCYLVIRGIATLPLRMQAHEAGARRVASYLAAHPRVRRVYYPGLPDHPGREVHERQATGYGGMIAFDVGSARAAERVVERVRLFYLAESLGGVESLIEVPSRMTHGSLPAEVREALGITDGLIRLSVGVEDPEDLVADLDQALAGI
ncbi:trans-sulfuration enzyme family protein [Caldinitratiruptor microaerophilus]|uniref:Cystathionine gamma-synthase n=1 Tax=Caldinitratiruptor microaerophilus TaxID=671077 RepID=A0AA35G5E5_9FIRM|nr:aminotransferase class I/II-fold pyridoxal phosphate-dependent enzyme [Caldinitratiruptor microaerophilus]BDG59251.1 cystathionine gamma-synthase [Caldinitratiruptor microaerophilus]